MVWSNLAIKILGINFGNFTLDNSIWDKISANITRKINLQNRVRLSLRGRKLIINQILLSKLWYIDQIYTTPKYVKKEIEKRISEFLWEGKKIHPHKHLFQLSFGRVGQAFQIQPLSRTILKLNGFKDYSIQLMPYGRISCCFLSIELNLEPTYGIALFKQNQIL